MNKLIALMVIGAAYCAAQLVIFIPAASVSAPPSSAPTGAVYIYVIDEGTGQTVTDSSGNGNDGTVGATSGSEASDPAWSTAGGDDYLDFDGGDRITAPSTTQTGDFTLAILWHHDSAASGYELWQASSSLQITNPDPPSNAWFIRAGTFILLPAGDPAVPSVDTWELTIVRRTNPDSDWEWCINDGACFEVDAFGPAGNITPTLIGGGGPNNDLNGGVAFAAVWDRALSDADITDLQAYVKSVKPGIVPY